MSKNKEVDKEEKQLDNEVVKEEVKEINTDEYISRLNNDLKEQQKKTDEYFEHLKRNMAEFDNFKKRISKEKDKIYINVTSDILESMLPILDNFEKAIGADCTDTNFKEGIVMIYDQIKDSLAKQGLEAIPDIGTTFDPNIHEAVMHEDNDQYGEKEIIDVFRTGYRLGNKIIRHSMVKVAN